MKLKNIIKTTILGSLLCSAAIMVASEEYAKVLFKLPNEKLQVCAHYSIEKTFFKIALYEAKIHNLKNNRLIGFIECTTNKNVPEAYIILLYIMPEARQKNYGRLIAQLALQELANQGFTKVAFIPGQIDTVKTEVLRDLYKASGATPTPGNKKEMEYDISTYLKTAPEPFNSKKLSDVMYYTKLLQAARTDNLQEVKRILKKGVSPEAQEEKEGQTALIQATIAGHSNIVHYLISQNAPLDTKDLAGKTALMHAANAGHRDILKYLIAHGARVNVQDKYGLSVLITMMRNKRFTKDDLNEVLRIGHFTPETKQNAADFARHTKRLDIAELIEHYNQPKAKL
ncbi:MAG TPA: GNAT family N-acetyltransferase [Candidatus Babeliales bacterium]|nr:GNAT family N-acetyltransferase [Candidatus Babeliales bacterium]